MNGIYCYGNGYGYAPLYTPQMGTGAQMPQRCQVIKVNGRNGADAFRMAADSSVLLLDENDPIVWLKTTDGAGHDTRKSTKGSRTVTNFWANEQRDVC